MPLTCTNINCPSSLRISFLKYFLFFPLSLAVSFSLFPHLVVVGCLGLGFLTVFSYSFHFGVLIVEKYIIFLFEIPNHLPQWEIEKLMSQILLLNCSEKDGKPLSLILCLTSFIQVFIKKYIYL